MFDRLKPKQSYFLLLALCTLAVVAVYASNGTVVLLAVGARTGTTATLSGHLKKFIKTPTGIFLGLLLSWSAVSLAWGIGGGSAAWLSFNIVLLSFVGFVFVAAVIELDSRRLRAAQNIVLAGTLIMIVLFIAEAATGGIVLKLLQKSREVIMNTVGRGTTILATILWPVLVLAWIRFRSRLILAALLFGACVAARLLPVDAAFAALIAGTIFFIAILYARRAALIVLFSIIALGMLSGPWLSLHVLNRDALAKIGIDVPESREHRLGIWGFVSGHIVEKPIIGSGFGASREIGRQEQLKFNRLQAKSPERLSQHIIRLPLHPHNIPLQIWLELGAVGVLLYLGILFGIVRHLWHSTAPPIWVAAAGASTVAYLAISSFSFGAWQNWWIATAWIAVGLLALARRAAADDTMVTA